MAEFLSLYLIAGTGYAAICYHFENDHQRALTAEQFPQEQVWAVMFISYVIAICAWPVVMAIDLYEWAKNR